MHTRRLADRLGVVAAVEGVVRYRWLFPLVITAVCGSCKLLTRVSSRCNNRRVVLHQVETDLMLI